MMEYLPTAVDCFIIPLGYPFMNAVISGTCFMGVGTALQQHYIPTKAKAIARACGR